MPQPETDLYTDVPVDPPTDIERLCSVVRDRGGVVLVAAMVDAGHSRWVLHKALQVGALTRVRRGWVALPGADRFLFAAANRGVVLTCVTQAKRLGLWVLEDDDDKRHHVGADPRSSRVTTATKVVVHGASSRGTWSLGPDRERSRRGGRQP